MVEQRLPIVNSDDGVWGDIIRQFLQKEHYNDDTNNPINGGHQTVTIRAGTTAAGTAPLKFASGSLLTAPEAGAVEFATDSLYFTITTGTVRKKIALYDDSAGATGDLYYRDGSGNFVRLGVGSAGKTLRVSSGLPAWGDATLATSTKTSNYTITGTDVVVFANATSGNVTITLPAASANAGYRFYVKRIDGSANSCTIARSGTDTIDGQTSLSLAQQYNCATVVSDGSTWYII
ncbi:MAG TPA: hypothetical protein VHT70_05230 [Candidatus Saccharimonadales bacterium]|jgi:hypothetical protein|nr:hypothetical protein [Candidatus Saccharimonadales bacterium]